MTAPGYGAASRYRAGGPGEVLGLRGGGAGVGGFAGDWADGGLEHWSHLGGGPPQRNSRAPAKAATNGNNRGSRTKARRCPRRNGWMRDAGQNSQPVGHLSWFAEAVAASLHPRRALGTAWVATGTHRTSKWTRTGTSRAACALCPITASYGRISPPGWVNQAESTSRNDGLRRPWFGWGRRAERCLPGPSPLWPEPGCSAAAARVRGGTDARTPRHPAHTRRPPIPPPSPARLPHPGTTPPGRRSPPPGAPRVPGGAAFVKVPPPLGTFLRQRGRSLAFRRALAHEHSRNRSPRASATFTASVSDSRSRSHANFHSSCVRNSSSIGPVILSSERALSSSRTSASSAIRSSTPPLSLMTYVLRSPSSQGRPAWARHCDTSASANTSARKIT